MRARVWVALWVAVCVSAQAAVTHEQWQPQREGEAVDARLDRRGDVEVLGRGVTAALGVLSERFGATLGVAPESVTTVGERRLTVLVQDGSLRDIMTQIPRALQECHWDVDRSGPAPAYLLHGDAGMRPSPVRRPSLEEGRAEAAEARRTYLDFAEQALALKEGELKGLEARSLYLACALRLPEERARAEALFSLGPEARGELVEQGHTYLPYDKASAQLQKVAREAIRRQLRWEAESRGVESEGALEAELPEKDDAALGDPTRAVVTLRQVGTRQCAEVTFHVRTATGAFASGFLLPGQEPQPGPEPVYYHGLLRAVGVTGEAAAARAAQWRQAEERRRLEEELLGEPRPIDPRLERPFHFTGEQTDLLSMLRAIAGTGVPVVSDAFSLPDVPVPPMAREEMPVWRFAAAIAKAADYECRRHGQYLVFHATGWRGYAPRELPEPVVMALRKKLETQGALSLDDLAAVAVALQARPLIRGPVLAPKDLALGDPLMPPTRLMLLRYATLTAGQVKQARRAEGLPVEKMSREQRAWLRAWAAPRGAEAKEVEHGALLIREEGEVARLICRLPDDRQVEVMWVALPRRK